MKYRFIIPFLGCITILPLTSLFGTETTWIVARQPLSNYAEERQFRTVSEAVEHAVPGDTIEIHTGIYRESIVIPKEKGETPQKPLRLVAAPTAEMVFCGSDVLKEWKPAPELGDLIAGTDWQHDAIPAHPGDEEHQIFGLPDQVFVNRYLLRRVLDAKQMAPGTFFIDYSQKRLYVWDSSNRNPQDFGALLIEASYRSFVLKVDADHVYLRGIRFRHGADRNQGGMALLRGNGIRLEDCVFEHSNGVGAVFTGTDSSVVRCEFTENGQLGFSACFAHRLHLDSCLIARNNVKNISRGWEAGVIKLFSARMSSSKSVFFVKIAASDSGSISETKIARSKIACFITMKNTVFFTKSVTDSMLTITFSSETAT